MSDKALTDISPTLGELSFTPDIQRLTDNFVGREWVFAEIDEWIRNSDETFFILTGEAGVGKSAIAARLTQIRDGIAAFNFCLTGRNSTIVPGTVLRSLAAQLGRNVPEYGIALGKTIKPTYLSINVEIHVGTMNGGHITGLVINNLTIADPKQEIESLLTSPLSAMPTPSHPILILLDSLDEAFTYNPAENLVTLLSGLTNLPSWVRFILTSRREERVLSYFPSVYTLVVAAASQPNREDLRRYVRYRLSSPIMSKRIKDAPSPKLIEALIEQIAGVDDDPGLADGNFLYSKILLNDIETGVQPLDDLTALPKSLDEIYKSFLLRLSPEWETRYQPLLAVLAIAREPLTPEQILWFGNQSARLIGGYMNTTLVNLALDVLVQFLHFWDDSGQIQYALFHQSFRDYLGNPTRSGRFSCPPGDGHNAIANYYLEHNDHDWSKCDRYGLRHLPAHLSGAQRFNELRALLLDFDWLQAKLDTTAVNALIDDYDLALNDTNLRLVQDALRLSAHILAVDKTQLAGQLLGRLLSFEDPVIKAMLEQAQKWRSTLQHPTHQPWLRPLVASLTPPGGPLIRTIEGHSGPIRTLALAPDGRRALSGSEDYTLKLWDMANGELEHTFIGHTDIVRAVKITPDGSTALSSSDDGTIRLWDLTKGGSSKIVKVYKDRVRAVALAPDGNIALCASAANMIDVWDLNNGMLLSTFGKHMSSVVAMGVTPDGSKALSASSVEIHLWDIQTGALLRTLTGHSNNVTAFEMTPNGCMVLSASLDGSLRLWELESAQTMRTFNGHNFPVNAVTITRDGRRALSAASDNTIKLWDLESGKLLNTFEGHTSAVTAVIATPDGQRALSASYDKTLKLWDLTAGRALPQLPVLIPRPAWMKRAFAVSLPIFILIVIALEFLNPPPTGVNPWPYFIANLTVGTFVFSASLIPFLLYTHFLATHRESIKKNFNVTLRLLGIDSAKSSYERLFTELYGEEDTFLPSMRSQVLIASMLFLIGWLWIIYPQYTSRILVDIFGINQNLPTYGFLGAYVYSLNTLFRKYFTHQLEPSLFISINKRVIVAFVLALYLLATTIVWRDAPDILLQVIAFSIGVFPRNMLLMLKRGAYRFLQIWDRAERSKAFPLSLLQGMSAFHEMRLREVGIDDLENLVTANLVDLWLHTHIPIEVLIDWIDQALLIVSSNREASSDASPTARVSDLGIRTASDLLAIQEQAASSPQIMAMIDERLGGPGEFENLVDAINSQPYRPILIRDWRTNIDKILLYDPCSVRALAVTPDGRKVLVASSNNNLALWDLNKGQSHWVLKGDSNLMNTVEAPSDGRTGITGSVVGTFKRWDLRNGNVLRVIIRYFGDLTAMAMTPDGCGILCALSDNSLKLLNLKDGRVLHTIEGHSDIVNVLAAMPDPRRALSVSSDNILRIWDLTRGKLIRTLTGNARIIAVAVSPNGQVVLSALEDNTMVLWDLESGEPFRIIQGHGRGVRGLAISPDGRMALSSSENRKLQLWDLESGKILASLNVDGALGPCAFAFDGKVLMAVAGDAAGKFHIALLENTKIGPAMVTAWCKWPPRWALWNQDQPPTLTVRCPHCSFRSPLPEAALGGEWMCQYCRTRLWLNAFTINADCRYEKIIRNTNRQ